MVDFWEIIEDEGDGTLSHWFFKDKHKAKNKVKEILIKALRKKLIPPSELECYNTGEDYSTIDNLIKGAWENEDGLFLLDDVVQCYPCTFDD